MSAAPFCRRPLMRSVGLIARRDLPSLAYDRLATAASRLQLHAVERWAHRRWLRRTLDRMFRRWRG